MFAKRVKRLSVLKVPGSCTGLAAVRTVRVGVKEMKVKGAVKSAAPPSVSCVGPYSVNKWRWIWGIRWSVRNVRRFFDLDSAYRSDLEANMRDMAGLLLKGLNRDDLSYLYDSLMSDEDAAVLIGQLRKVLLDRYFGKEDV